MGEVIPLPRPCVVELFAGLVSRSVVHANSGPIELESPQGVQRYFVQLVDIDGTRIGLWDGSTYDQAVKEALAIQRAWAPARFIDHVGGAA